MSSQQWFTNEYRRGHDKDRSFLRSVWEYWTKPNYKKRARKAMKQQKDPF